TIDTAFLATASADGQPYVQHRGGPRGFLRVMGESTIAFADFAGNKQFVTTGNLAENDRVCLLAMDYAQRARVKIWGRAHIVPATPELVALVGDPSYRARVEQIVVIEVEAWDANCPQHIPRLVRASALVDLVRRRRRAARRRLALARRRR
ncbi:MAG TPA: pyridoxamine 5'-phosphate oxidase family protein, partial [Labilithrix sp.]